MGAINKCGTFLYSILPSRLRMLYIYIFYEFGRLKRVQFSFWIPFGMLLRERKLSLATIFNCKLYRVCMQYVDKKWFGSVFHVTISEYRLFNTRYSPEHSQSHSNKWMKERERGKNVPVNFFSHVSYQTGGSYKTMTSSAMEQCQNLVHTNSWKVCYLW